MTRFVSSAEECVNLAIERVGKHIVLGAPLGLGKPIQLMNAFYRRAGEDPELSLHIYTALTLERPKPGSKLEASLAGPIMERLFEDYEDPAWMAPLNSGTLPPNVQVSELYFKAGSMKKNSVAQRNYISSNYTHIARDLVNAGVNVLAGLVGHREVDGEQRLSMSCNPDTGREVVELLRQRGTPFINMVQTHPDLPYMLGPDVEGPADDTDVVLTNPEYDRKLFAVPNAAVPLADYATALHASTLIPDGGTLQIGIGALGDAVAQACILRHRANVEYHNMLQGITQVEQSDPTLVQNCGTFANGLYCSTEMFVNGMLHLIENGVIKRRVYDHLAIQQGINTGAISHEVNEQLLDFGREQGFVPRVLDANQLADLQSWGILPDACRVRDDQLLLGDTVLMNDLDDPATRQALLAEASGAVLRRGHLLHGGFFLGPRDFYAKLRAMSDAEREEISMTSVQRTNQLLQNPPLYMAQRTGARFINTGMIVTLTGAVASDALDDGTVISGVGGQYNFVAMAHDLPGARSVLCIRATRGDGKTLVSNIVPSYGHTTIPRHLRDIIVTEYGIADLRGQSDEEVIKRLVAVADSRFQDELVASAKRHGKLDPDYRIPEAFRHNKPETLRSVLQPYVESGLLPAYPFGCDLTEQEIALAATLREIKALSDEPAHFIKAAFRALLHKSDEKLAKPWLERINLEHPDTTRDFLVQQLLLLELEEKGFLKAS